MLTQVECTSCGATLSLAPDLKTVVCPYCDTPSVVERPPTPGRAAPTFVVGFVVENARAADLVRRWIKSRGLFVRSEFKNATLEKTRGVYLPAWIYNAIAHASYRAQIGEDYWEEETYTETDANGKQVTKTRRVRKTEYRPLSGMWRGRVSDVIVTGSRGLSNDELEEIEPFDLRALRRYTHAVVSGWMAEECSVSPGEALELARGEAVAQVASRLSAFMPGDSHRSLEHSTDFLDETIDLVLLPVWVFSARWHPDHPPVRILVNGQTGEVQGGVPISWIKVLVAVLLAAAVVALGVWFVGRH